MRQQFTAPNGDDIMIDLPDPVAVKRVAPSPVQDFRYAFRKEHKRPPTGDEIRVMLREAMRKKK